MTEKPAPPPKPDKPVIREMPDKSLLADFLRGLSGAVTVIFNSETGRFERVQTGDNRD